MSGGLRAAIVPVTPFEQNCTLLWNDETNRGTVIDPGGDVPDILAAIAQCGMLVEKILLTHGHLDHAGGAAELRDALRDQAAAANPACAVPIEGPHERDRFLLDSLAAQGARFGIEGLRNVSPDRWLGQGDRIEIAGFTFEVLHCPGHTPGHIVFVQHDLAFAHVGDVLFQGSVGRTDFPYGNHAELIASIRDRLLPLPDEVSFLCGHGPGSTIGAERRTNPFLS